MISLVPRSTPIHWNGSMWFLRSGIFAFSVRNIRFSSVCISTVLCIFHTAAKMLFLLHIMSFLHLIPSFLQLNNSVSNTHTIYILRIKFLCLMRITVIYYVLNLFTLRIILLQCVLLLVLITSYHLLLRIICFLEPTTERNFPPQVNTVEGSDQ